MNLVIKNDLLIITNNKILTIINHCCFIIERYKTTNLINKELPAFTKPATVIKPKTPLKF